MNEPQFQQSNVDLDPAGSQVGGSVRTGHDIEQRRSQDYTLIDILRLLAKAARPALVAAVLLFLAAVLLQLTLLRVYASHATLQLDQTRAAILQSPELWSRVEKDSGAVRLEVRRIPIIRKGVTNFSWYDVRGVGRSSSEAQALLDHVIVVLRELTAPRSAELESASAKRQWLLRTQDIVQDALASVISTSKDEIALRASADVTEMVVRFTDLIDSLEHRMALINESHAGFEDEDIISPPSLPSDMPDDMWRNAILAGLFAIFCVISTLLMLDAYHRLQKNAHVSLGEQEAR